MQMPPSKLIYSHLGADLRGSTAFATLGSQDIGRADVGVAPSVSKPGAPEPARGQRGLLVYH